jgi:serine/threonine protein phosphatase PrpC
MSLAIHAFGDTNKGLFREINEDNLMVGRTVFAVADGMGGHAAGEVASAAALGPLRTIDGETYRDPEAASEALADAVRQANDLVIGKAVEDPDLRGMGTTLTTVMVRGRRLHLAHVGDSRAYLLRGGVLQMLTEDHTLVHQLVKEGRLTEEQAATHPQRSVITRAIGVEPGVEVDVMPPLELMPGDQILLCSDGLTGPVSDSLIADILKGESDGNIACQRLIDAANAGGGPDNITTVLLRVEGDGVVAPPGAELPRTTSDDDATADLGAPTGGAGATGGTSADDALDARRLAVLAHGDPQLDTGPGPAATGRGRRIAAVLVGVAVLLAVVGGGAALLLSRQYFVGVGEDGDIGIYRGIEGQVLGVSLSTLVERQSFGLEDLPERLHPGLEDGIAFSTLAEAEAHVETVLLPATQETAAPDGEADDPASDPAGDPAAEEDKVEPTPSTDGSEPAPAPS